MKYQINYLILNDTDIDKVEKAIAYTKNCIEYDKELAREISDGSFRRDALSAIEEKSGTCSEYANIFITLMRNQNIPARFVVGKIYRKSFHAWSEIYIDGKWIAVDPQFGKFGVTNRHIKLYHGLDYPDIGIKLREINIRTKRKFKKVD